MLNKVCGTLSQITSELMVLENKTYLPFLVIIWVFQINLLDTLNSLDTLNIISFIDLWSLIGTTGVSDSTSVHVFSFLSIGACL